MKCKKCDKKLTGVVIAGCCLPCYQEWQKRHASYEAKQRLKYLRGEIEKKQISYEEIAELQSLAEYIPEDDTLLREWAGIPEFKE